MHDLGFVISVEEGRLAGEAVLLAQSIREWAGAVADAPIYAFGARPQHRPTPATVADLEAAGITWFDQELEGLSDEYPTYNKIFRCSWAERNLEHETLVFVDSDSVFLREPTALLEGDWIAAARPVDRRIAGSKGKGKNEPYWRRMYETLGVKSEPFVETVVGRMRIRAYWNTGLIAVKRAAGLFTAWERAHEKLFESGVVHKMPQFMDQISWAGATADVFDRTLILPDTYNYPLRQRGGLDDAAGSMDLDEIVHLHYRLFFHLPDPLAEVQPPFDRDTPQYRWLDERLPLHPLVEAL